MQNQCTGIKAGILKRILLSFIWSASQTITRFHTTLCFTEKIKKLLKLSGNNALKFVNICNNLIKSIFTDCILQINKIQLIYVNDYITFCSYSQYNVENFVILCQHLLEIEVDDLCTFQEQIMNQYARSNCLCKYYKLYIH